VVVPGDVLLTYHVLFLMYWIGPCSTLAGASDAAILPSGMGGFSAAKAGGC